MKEVKVQTMQERFGFQDKELSTPRHDEIMLWLDEWVESNMHTALGWDGVDVRDTEGSKDCRYVTIDKVKVGPLPDFPPVKVSKKVWEVAIVNKGYTIGFADMAIQYRRPALQFAQDSGRFWIEEGWDHVVYFEVKPVVPSLGELIRQIRMYQTYTNIPDYSGSSPKWFVVTPDTRFKNQLKAQGIGLIEVK
jgi:hypothetical protein